MNARIKPPAEPQDGPLYLPTDVSPEEVFQAVGRQARDEIDRLIQFLASWAAAVANQRLVASKGAQPIAGRALGRGDAKLGNQIVDGAALD